MQQKFWGLNLLVCCFTANQYSECSTIFFSTFETKEHVLRVEKIDITGENASNEYLAEIEENHESSEDEKSWI